MKFYKVMEITVLTYACGIWNMPMAGKERLYMQTSEMKFLRHVWRR